jgi:hypothetical protein
MSQSGMTFGTCQYVSSRVQCGPMELGLAVTVNAAQPRRFIPQQACTVGHCGPDGLDPVLASTRPKAPGSSRKGAPTGIRRIPTSPNLPNSGRAAPNADRCSDLFGRRTAHDPEAANQHCRTRAPEW